MIWQKINYIHQNPVKAGLVRSAKDFYWSSFRSFYSPGNKALAVDQPRNTFETLLPDLI